MENRDRLGAGNSSSKQDFWRRGSSSAAATTKATFTTSSAPSSTNHQRKLSSASTRTTGSTGITRPRSLTVTKSAKEHSQPPPTTSRHRRLSSTSVTCTSAQPATSSCSAISRVAQRTNNPPPSLSRSATAPVLSRHEVVTVVHTDKESYPRNAKLIDKKGTTQSANARISSSAPPNKPLKPSSTVLPPTASKLQQPTTVRISHQHRHTPSVTTPTTNLPINPAHLTAPNTTTTQSTNSSPNQDPNSLNVSSSRPGSSYASARSSPTPPKKHAPARFSSNGVETSGGPPPSLAYRRRFSMDNRGVYSTPSTPSNRPGYTRDQAGDSSTSSATISALPISRTGTAQGQRDTRRHSTKAMQRRQSYSSYDDEDDDDEEEDESGERDRTIRGLEDLRNNGGVPANSDQSNEDVFLKLARSNSTTSRAADRLERRRTRLSQHSQYRNSMPAETQSSPIAPASIFNSSPPEVREDVWRRNARMSSPADYRTRRMSQASEHLEDRTSVTPRASFGARPQSMLRRENSPGHSRSYSMADSSPRTGLANRASTRGLSASPQIDDNSGPSLIDQDFALSVAGGGGGGRSADSASTVSTTAASSVWDELDDLKSRIRRLEVTGHIPASRAGGASNSSGDRPRTATTTVTTVSSSPRHNAAGISPVNSTFSGTPNATTSHPLLHTALAKSKAVMPPDVYKYLELAAKDALDLANTVGAPGAAAPTNMSADRTVRRKADSVCRSLTELCLALSENRHNIAPAHHPFIQAQFAGSRPASRAFGMESVIGRDRESILAGRESVLGDRLPPRAIGRFAERKNSLASLSVAAGYSPRSDPIASPTTAGTIRHRNSMGLKEGFLEERERERFRAPSRAITEVNATPRLPNSRLSHPTTREYTTQDTNSTLPLRRSSIAPTGTHSSPLGPNPNKRFFSDNPSRMSQEFTMTGGPVNDRLVNAANADPDMSTRFANGSLGRTGSRRIVRGLRESVDLDSGRLTALRRAEAATERLLRR